MKRYVFVVDYYSKNLNIGNQRLQSASFTHISLKKICQWKGKVTVTYFWLDAQDYMIYMY